MHAPTMATMIPTMITAQATCSIVKVSLVTAVFLRMRSGIWLTRDSWLMQAVKSETLLEIAVVTLAGLRPE